MHSHFLFFVLCSLTSSHWSCMFLVNTSCQDSGRICKAPARPVRTTAGQKLLLQHLSHFFASKWNLHATLNTQPELKELIGVALQEWREEFDFHVCVQTNKGHMKREESATLTDSNWSQNFSSILFLVVLTG